MRDVATGKRRYLGGHQTEVAALAFSPDGKTLASGDASGMIKLWDLTTGKELVLGKGRERENTCEGTAVLCLAFSPDGKTLASSGNDDAIRLWDVLKVK